MLDHVGWWWCWDWDIRRWHHKIGGWPVLPLVICFVAVGLCVGDDEEDLVDRANDREPVMLKGGRMRERERGPRPPFQGHSCLLKYHLDLEKINISFKKFGEKERPRSTIDNGIYSWIGPQSPTGWSVLALLGQLEVSFSVTQTGDHQLEHRSKFAPLPSAISIQSHTDLIKSATAPNTHCFRRSSARAIAKILTDTECDPDASQFQRRVW